MIRSVPDFIRYFEGVRRRTWVAVDRVTPALVAGARGRMSGAAGPSSGTWRGGALLRARAWSMTGWTDDLDPGPERDLEATRALLSEVHAPRWSGWRRCSTPRLEEPIRDLEGQTMRLWRFLMAMVEHEVHHRSQLDCWLAEARATPPQLYGYRMEDVTARARRGPGRIC